MSKIQYLNDIHNLGIQKKFLAIFYEVVFSSAWTKSNLKSFLLLWFCIPLLGLIALDLQTFTSEVFFLLNEIPHKKFEQKI